MTPYETRVRWCESHAGEIVAAIILAILCLSTFLGRDAHAGGADPEPLKVGKWIDPVSVAVPYATATTGPATATVGDVSAQGGGGGSARSSQQQETNNANDSSALVNTEVRFQTGAPMAWAPPVPQGKCYTNTGASAILAAATLTQLHKQCALQLYVETLTEINEAEGRCDFVAQNTACAPLDADIASMLRRDAKRIYKAEVNWWTIAWMRIPIIGPRF